MTVRGDLNQNTFVRIVGLPEAEIGHLGRIRYGARKMHFLLLFLYLKKFSYALIQLKEFLLIFLLKKLRGKGATR